MTQALAEVLLLGQAQPALHAQGVHTPAAPPTQNDPALQTTPLTAAFRAGHHAPGTATHTPPHALLL
jgi:hypothetical protein